MPVSKTHMYLQSLTLYCISGGHLDHALEWYVHHVAFLDMLMHLRLSSSPTSYPSIFVQQIDNRFGMNEHCPTGCGHKCNLFKNHNSNVCLPCWQVGWLSEELGRVDLFHYPCFSLCHTKSKFSHVIDLANVYDGWIFYHYLSSRQGLWVYRTVI